MASGTIVSNVGITGASGSQPRSAFVSASGNHLDGTAGPGISLRRCRGASRQDNLAAGRKELCNNEQRQRYLAKATK
ncbi:MAG: hypothetical protein KIT83_16865 [Bryobacterales bacterium]|nr:hypothetical protein [Bryobacterales bacterium]